MTINRRDMLLTTICSSLGVPLPTLDEHKIEERLELYFPEKLRCNWYIFKNSEKGSERIDWNAIKCGDDLLILYILDNKISDVNTITVTGDVILRSVEVVSGMNVFVLTVYGIGSKGFSVRK